MHHSNLFYKISQSLVSLFLCRTLATVKVNKVRYVVWSADMAYVALLGKHGKLKGECYFVYLA